MKRYVNGYSLDDGTAVLVDRSGGYRAPPLLEHVDVRHACFIDRASLSEDVLRELKTASAVKAIIPDGRFYRVEWADRFTCKTGSEFLEQERGVKTFEANVDPLLRLMVERDIRPARPRTLYWDLETDPRPGLQNKLQMRILVIALVDAATRKKKALVLDEFSDEGERRLLEKFIRYLDFYDQLVGWNSDRFDEPVFKARIKKLGIAWDPRRVAFVDHMRVYQKQNMMGAESGDEKQSFALNSIAKSLGLAGKHDVDARLAFDMWEAGGEERTKLADYAVNDADLMPQIEEKTGYLELFWTLCDSTMVFPVSRNIGPSFQVESFLLRLAKERNHRFFTRFAPERGNQQKSDDEDFDPRARSDEDDEQFRGAFVYKPNVAGIQRDVHCVDFARMYPSIIRSLNLSPETKVERPKPSVSIESFPPYLVGSPAYEKAIAEAKAIQEMRPPAGVAVSSTGAWFVQEPIGILPLAVEKLLELRKFWDNKKKSFPPGTPEWEDANRRSSAYKIAVNSFYGVVGQASSMFFDVDVAESTTITGVTLIKATMELAESPKWGKKTIYGDTDGAYFKNSTIERMKAFTEECNAELFPRLLREMGGRNYISIEYEKAFKIIVFSWNEKEGRSSAKKYAAKFSFFKGKLATEDSKPEIKGLAYKRGDSFRLARVMQREVIEELITKEQSDPFAFDELITRWRKRITEEKLDRSEVAVSKSITKRLDEYFSVAKKVPISLGPARVDRIDEKGIYLDSTFLEMLHGRRKRIFVRYTDIHDKCSLFKVRPNMPKNELERYRLVDDLLVNDFSPIIQVRVAMMLEAHGVPVRPGDRVEWVVLNGNKSPKEVVPALFWDGETIDRVELWMAVWTPSKHLLWGAFPDVDWKRFDLGYPKKERTKREPGEIVRRTRKKVSAGQSLFDFGKG